MNHRSIFELIVFLKTLGVFELQFHNNWQPHIPNHVIPIGLTSSDCYYTVVPRG